MNGYNNYNSKTITGLDNSSLTDLQLPDIISKILVTDDEGTVSGVIDTTGVLHAYGSGAYDFSLISATDIDLNLDGYTFPLTDVNGTTLTNSNLTQSSLGNIFANAVFLIENGNALLVRDDTVDGTYPYIQLDANEAIFGRSISTQSFLLKYTNSNHTTNGAFLISRANTANANTLITSYGTGYLVLDADTGNIKFNDNVYLANSTSFWFRNFTTNSSINFSAGGTTGSFKVYINEEITAELNVADGIVQINGSLLTNLFKPNGSTSITFQNAAGTINALVIPISTALNTTGLFYGNATSTLTQSTWKISIVGAVNNLSCSNGNITIGGDINLTGTIVQDHYLIYGSFGTVDTIRIATDSFEFYDFNELNLFALLDSTGLTVTTNLKITAYSTSRYLIRTDTSKNLIQDSAWQFNGTSDLTAAKTITCSNFDCSSFVATRNLLVSNTAGRINQSSWIDTNDGNTSLSGTGNITTTGNVNCNTVRTLTVFNPSAGGYLQIGTTSANNIYIYTNNVNTWSFDTSGNLGPVASTYPTLKIHANNNTTGNNVVAIINSSNTVTCSNNKFKWLLSAAPTTLTAYPEGSWTDIDFVYMLADILIYLEGGSSTATNMFKSGSTSILQFPSTSGFVFKITIAITMSPNNGLNPLEFRNSLRLQFSTDGTTFISDISCYQQAVVAYTFAISSVYYATFNYIWYFKLPSTSYIYGKFQIDPNTTSTSVDNCYIQKMNLEIEQLTY